MGFLAPILMAMATGAASSIGSNMFGPHPPQYGQTQKNNAGGALDFGSMASMAPHLNPSVQTSQQDPGQFPDQRLHPMPFHQNPFQNPYQQYQGLM